MSQAQLCDPAYVCDPMAWLGLAAMLIVPVVVLAEVVLFFAFGPIQQAIVHCRLAWVGLKLMFKNPAVALVLWAVTTTPDFPVGLVFLRYLASFALAIAIVVGGGLAALDWLKGPVNEKYFRNADGTVFTRKERVRVKHKRPVKLDKAIKEVTPYRNQVAFRVAKKCEARELAHMEAGVKAPARKWWEKKLIEKLPTEKAKASKASKDITKTLKKIEHADLDAEMEIMKDQLASKPPPPGGKPTEAYLATLNPPPYEGVTLIKPERDAVEQDEEVA